MEKITDNNKLMQFKGTPGPWAYQEDSDAYTHIVRPLNQWGRIISHLGQSNSLEQEANDRLIAAAPELLEALQIAKVELEKFIPITEVDVLRKIITVINKALCNTNQLPKNDDWKFTDPY